MFSDEDARSARRKRTITAAAAAGAVLAASVLAFLLIRTGGKNVSEDIAALLERGDSGKDVELLLHMDYNGHVLDREISISVLPERVDAEKADELFDACETWLSEELKNGPVFPKTGPGGVALTWQEEQIDCLGIDGPTDVVLTVQLGAGEYTRVSEVTVRFDPDAEDYEKSLALLSERLGEDLSSDAEGTALSLPSDAEGASLTWSAVKKQAPAYIIATGAFAAAFIWLSRDDAAERRLKKRRSMLEAELPNMIFRMMLLLNAGLIAESAFAKITEQSREDRNPLYRAFRDIKMSAEKKNTSFVNELHSFAKASDSADLLRFASLAAEHAGSGAELAGKLEQERDRMWNFRVTNAKAKIKEAETKLCFPLVLLLLALIIITAAPSFMNM
ncbi:MAG: hypothetical protein IKI73_06450 [Firmicutes bacterium]|nr:hypothetical protein [Bacillota bacterium]MBR6237078.1 hypothetical protein [Bacillota bacterium]